MSEASQMWNWRMNVSSEHWPMKQKSCDELERRAAVCVSKDDEAEDRNDRYVAW